MSDYKLKISEILLSEKRTVCIGGIITPQVYGALLKNKSLHLLDYSLKSY